MNLTKEIIAEIVSYVNLADIKKFVLTHPELVQEGENKKIFIIGSIVTGVIIQKVSNLEYIDCDVKGAK